MFLARSKENHISECLLILPVQLSLKAIQCLIGNVVVVFKLHIKRVMLLNKIFKLALLLGKYPFSILTQKFICICVCYEVKSHFGLKIIYF